MDTMNIALPKPLKDFVHDQVSKGSYSSASEYMRELIRGDQRAKTVAELEAAVLDGLRSGPASPMTSEDWDHIRAEVRKRAAARVG